MEVKPHPLQSQVVYEGDKNFMEKLLFQIYQDFSDQHLVDITFKVLNPTALVTAHAVILSATSPYFRELFNSDKGSCPQIEITDIDSVTFENLMTYCYTGKISLNLENVETMLKAAVKLQLDGAVVKCADLLIENIPHYPLKQIYALERELQSDAFNQSIFEYDSKHFMDITQNAQFLDFSPSKLKKLVENDDLIVEHENDVFEAVKRWYKHNALARREQLPDLVACLRLTMFDKDFIMKNIHSLPGCQSLALEALSCDDSSSARSSNGTLKYTKPREGEEKCLFVLNLEETPQRDFYHDKGYRAIYQYNTNAYHDWDKWTDIKIDGRDFGIIFMDDSLFFIGGYGHKREGNEACSWNIKTKIFKQIPSMNKARLSHSLAILNDKIYAIGGRSRNETIKSVEVYCASYGWRLIKDMITPRCDAGAVAYNGKLYVMGGSNVSALKSVECYDPLTNSWTECSDMTDEYESCSATVHKGYIFVACGNFDKISAIVERYDPPKNEWIKFFDFEDYYTKKTCCFSYQNRLWAYFAIGGTEDIDDTEGRVWVYIDEDEEWLAVNRLPIEDRTYCFFIVPKNVLNK